MKRIYTELTLKLDIAEYILEKALKPCHKRAIVIAFSEKYQHGKSKACRILKTSSNSLNHRQVKADSSLIAALSQLSAAHAKEGFWKCYRRLRNKPVNANHNWRQRGYKQIEWPFA